MLLLFVWFLLFKFPPARRGKQSLTVKQIGTFFFFCWFNYLKPSIKYKLFQRQWRLFRLNLLFVPLCQFFLNPRIGPGHYSVSDGSPHERNNNELSLLWVTEGWETRFASFIAKRERICHNIVVRPGRRPDWLRNTRSSLVELNVHICTFYFNKLIANFR